MTELGRWLTMRQFETEPTGDMMVQTQRLPVLQFVEPIAVVPILQVELVEEHKLATFGIGLPSLAWCGMRKRSYRVVT